MIERSYTTKEVSELLCCDAETVLRYAQRGDLKSWRLGRDRRYTESAVQAFIDRQSDPVVPLPRIRSA